MMIKGASNPSYSAAGLFQTPSFLNSQRNTPKVDLIPIPEKPRGIEASSQGPISMNPSHSAGLMPPRKAGGRSPFLEMGCLASNPSDNHMTKSLSVRVNERLEQLSPSLRDIVGNYLDRFKADGDVISRVWLNAFVGVPSESTPPTSITRDAAKTHSDSQIIGQESAKKAIIDQLVFWQITELNRFKLCLVGPPGVGKTCLLKSLGDIYGRPVVTLNMDSVGDETTLIGHAPSYQGNNLGSFLNAIMQAGCNNPIIFIDELDKIKRDVSGRRILDLLNQWLDDERAYFDSAYLGMRIDLSQCAFVIAANDLSQLSHCQSLADRMQPVIYMEGYTVEQQREILLENILPKLNNLIPAQNQVVFSEDAVEALLERYQKFFGGKPAGVRVLKDWTYFVLKRAVAEQKRIVDAELIEKSLESLTRELPLKDMENFNE